MVTRSSTKNSSQQNKSGYHLRNTGHERYRNKTVSYLFAQYILNQYIVPELHAHHIFDSAGKKLSIDTLIQREQSQRWLRALSNK